MKKGFRGTAVAVAALLILFPWRASSGATRRLGETRPRARVRSRRATSPRSFPGRSRLGEQRTGAVGRGESAGLRQHDRRLSAGPATAFGGARGLARR